MPLYPYRCTECGHRFEKIQKFGAKPEQVCPKCGGALERPLTAPGLQFKGAGWYVNDYASKGSGSSAAESTPAEKKSSSETKAESPSAANNGAASSTSSTPSPSSPAATTNSSSN